LPGGSAPSPTSSARTLHAFLVASTLIISSGAFITTKSLTGLESGSGFTGLEAVALLLGASDLLLVTLIRSRLPTRGAGRSADEWWRRHLGRAVLLWTLLEFLALLGAITLFATRRVTAFGVLTLIALAALLSVSPSRLAGD
jgi:hypothetical protein